MTKIWCTLCNETNFEANPPTPQHVVNHLRAVHLPITINNPADRQLWHQHQNTVWSEREKWLLKKTRTSNLFEQARYESQLQKHMEVYDDKAEIQDLAKDSKQQAGVGGHSAAEIEAAETLIAMSDSGSPVASEERPVQSSQRELEAGQPLQTSKDGETEDDTSSTAILDEGSDSRKKTGRRRFFGIGSKLWEKAGRGFRRG